MPPGSVKYDAEMFFVSFWNEEVIKLMFIYRKILNLEKLAKFA